MLKNKYSKSRIHDININDSWSSDPQEIMKEVFEYYNAKFHEPVPNIPKLINPFFKKLHPSQCSLIESPFSIEEIKAAIWGCGAEKAPGPDGYTFKFIKEKWECMKDDIIRYIRHFEKTRLFSKGCNSSFITLVPKVKDPISLTDYRPISLIGCIY